jgi:hypothetical protein
MNTFSSTFKSVVKPAVINFTGANSSDYILKATFMLCAVKGVTAGFFITDSDSVGMALAVFVINTLYCITFQNG